METGLLKFKIALEEKSREVKWTPSPLSEISRRPASTDALTYTSTVPHTLICLLPGKSTSLLLFAAEHRFVFTKHRDLFQQTDTYTNFYLYASDSQAGKH